MNWIIRRIKLIMLISGALTATMIQAAFAPRSALTANFGETLEGAVAEIVVRNWGALIGLIGAMLIYGAFNPPVRALVVVVAGVSKAVFIGLVLAQGRRFLQQPVGVAVAIDLVMIALFVWYLYAVRHSAKATGSEQQLAVS
jgi:hypothetical protein